MILLSHRLTLLEHIEIFCNGYALRILALKAVPTTRIPLFLTNSERGAQDMVGAQFLPQKAAPILRVPSEFVTDSERRT